MHENRKSEKLLHIGVQVLTGTHVGAGSLHLQGHQRRGGLEGGGDILGQTLVDVACEGGITPAGTSG